MSTLDTNLETLSEHYNRRVERYGYAPEAVHFTSWETIERRFDVLLEGFPDFRSSSILDFGCGIGHLYSYLKRQGFEGSYAGFDIAEGMVQLARSRYPGVRFEHANLIAKPVSEGFDIAVVSGVFNNALDCNLKFLERALETLYQRVNCGLAFNALSCFVHYRDEGLFYYDPIRVFEFCKTKLTPRVALRHDYEIKPGVIPFEFTMYLYKAGYAPVPAMQ